MAVIEKHEIIDIDRIKAAVNKAVEVYPQVVKVVLFGSYARGEQTQQSDIDIFVESNCKLIGMKVLGFTEVIREELGVTPDSLDVIESKYIEMDSTIREAVDSEGVILFER